MIVGALNIQGNTVSKSCKDCQKLTTQAKLEKDHWFPHSFLLFYLPILVVLTCEGPCFWKKLLIAPRLLMKEHYPLEYKGYLKESIVNTADFLGGNGTLGGQNIQDRV